MWPAAGPVSSAPTAVSTLAQRKTRMLNMYILYQTVMFHKEFLHVPYIEGHHDSIHIQLDNIVIPTMEVYVPTLEVSIVSLSSQNHSILKLIFK